MKKIKFTFGSWEDFYEQEIEIPEDMAFFFKRGAIHNMKCDGCEHYTTVIETKKYKKWLKYLESITSRNIYIEEFDKYSIICFSNVKSPVEFQITDRNEWFIKNKIDFSKYAIAEYDEYERLKNVCRITEFIDSYECNYIMASMRNAISSSDYYSISSGNTMFSNIVSHYKLSLSTYKVLSGKKAITLWNSTVANVLSHFMFDEKFVDKNETFQSENTEKLLKIKKSLENDQIFYY